jgi:hypothetical protein
MFATNQQTSLIRETRFTCIVPANATAQNSGPGPLCSSFISSFRNLKKQNPRDRIRVKKRYGKREVRWRVAKARTYEKHTEQHTERRKERENRTGKDGSPGAQVQHLLGHSPKRGIGGMGQ